VSTRREDDFADIINTTQGVFGDNSAGLDPGLSKHDSVDVGVTGEGAVFEFTCPGCGRSRQLVIEYPELVALKYRISPHMAFQGQGRAYCQDASVWRWVKDEHKWGLQMKCNLCPYHYPLRLSPAEPEAILGKARRASLINPVAEQQVMQYVDAVRQRMRPQQR
jgi:hypothetical protein